MLAYSPVSPQFISEEDNETESENENEKSSWGKVTKRKSNEYY
jgi:hypothetical protein